jgi:hypothetical protein
MFTALNERQSWFLRAISPEARARLLLLGKVLARAVVPGKTHGELPWVSDPQLEACHCTTPSHIRYGSLLFLLV